MLLETESGIWAKADATVFGLLMDGGRTERRLFAAGRTIDMARQRVATLRRLKQMADARAHAAAEREVAREFSASWGRTVRVRVPHVLQPKTAKSDRSARRSAVSSHVSTRAIRAYPLFAMPGASTAFAGGGVADISKGMQVAVLATQMRKDIVYLGWRAVDDAEPATFSVALRQMLQVDWIDGLFPFAATATAPIVLVSTRRNEFIAVGSRGLLELCPGKPKSLRAGKALAKKRMRRAFASMRNQLADDNVFLMPGEAWREPSAQPTDTVIRFG